MHPSHTLASATGSEPTPDLFDLTTIPLPHHQDLDSGTTLFLPSDDRDSTSLLPDINYFALQVSEVGTTMTSWDGIETSNLAVLDNFEKNFGSYIYPQ